MLKLTNEEQRFLKAQDILESELFDAKDMTGKQFRPIMKDLGFNFAVGKPCNKARHRLRTRANHCIQCDTSKIVFQRRWRNYGEVYVALAQDVKLVKVGTAKDASSREASLNSCEYGGSSNWKIAFVERCDYAGRIEHCAHVKLQQYQSPGDYFKDGHLRQCRELFKCSHSKAIEAVRAAVSNA